MVDLLDVEQQENPCDYDDVQEQPDNGDRVVGSRSLVVASFASGGSTRTKIGTSDTASPIVTASAAHFGPSSAIAHNDKNTVAPMTTARPTRSRASGRGSPSRRAVLDSK